MLVLELKNYIYKQNKIEYVLNSLGCTHIKYHKEKEYYSCAHADGDNNNAVNIKNNQYLNYRSWTRNVSFEDNQDLIDLIQYTKNFDFISALKWLHEILELEYTIQAGYKLKPTENLKDKMLSVFTKHLSCSHPMNVADINVLDETILDEYIPIEHISLLHEGISPQTCKKYNIEYSYKRHRIMIPIRFWATGELLGFNARTTIEAYDELGISKYHFTKGYNKSINLYGLWENMEYIKKHKQIVVFESEKSVLKRDTQYDRTAVALGGKTLSDEQKRILLGLGCEIIIALDKDADINESRCMCEKLYQVKMGIPISYIYDIDNLLGTKDSPADKGDNIYQTLFKNRIIYDEEEHNKYMEAIGR